LWKDVGGVRTYFFYADEGLIAEYDATGTEISSYGYQPDSTWTTDPLWLKKDGQYYWYQNDHLGTPQKLVDSTGTVVWSAQYTAFGEAVIDIETVTNHLRFPGQYADDETGLHYNWFRYYDPGIGRYLRVDPIGFAGMDVNLYAYVWNTPVTRFDVYGLKRQHTVKECHIDILAGHYDDTPDRIKIPDCAGATINCCHSHGGVDRVKGKRPPKTCDPEAFPGSQYKEKPIKRRIDPKELIDRTRADIKAAEEHAKQLCRKCPQCQEIIIQVVCFGELKNPPPTPTPFPGLPEIKEPQYIYIGEAHFLCRKKRRVPCGNQQVTPTPKTSPTPRQ
jgi:RHS repeat-associated protein